MHDSPPLPVDARDAAVLRGWVESGSAGAAAVRRARIVLLSGDGLGPSVIAEELGCSRPTVITWRERYRSGGLAGLRDAPRSGRPATVDAMAVVTRTLEGPGPTAARWSTRLLASELGISNVAVANVWRTWGITPTAGGRVRLGTEPALDVPVAGVVGLHLDPPIRLLALLADAPDRDPNAEPVLPVRQRPDLGTRLADGDRGDCPGGGCPDALAEFLGRLEPLAASRVRLLAETATDLLQPWVQARPGAVLHLVPAGLSWVRLVRVACVLAGASDSGAASVTALRGALADRVDGKRWSWIQASANNMQ